MGSVVISDVATASTRFSHTILAGHAHQQQVSPEGSLFRQQPTHPSQPASLASQMPSSSGQSANPILMRDQGDLSGVQAADHTSRQGSSYDPLNPGITRSLTSPAHDAPARPPVYAQHSTESNQGVQDPVISSTMSGPGPSGSALGPLSMANSLPHSPVTSPLQLASSISSASTPPASIKIRDLAHIQQLASDGLLPSQTSQSRRTRRDTDRVGTKFEISGMHVTDVIEMVAGLLTKITTTNDRQHEHMHRNIPPPDSASGLSQQTSSVLAFHGKNVPSITILSYLSRIHKYCPTTYEVFLSLLVYFDRMTEMVNANPAQAAPESSQDSLPRSSNTSHRRQGSRNAATDMGGSAPALIERSEQPRTDASTSTPPPSGSLDAHRSEQDLNRVPSSPQIVPAPSQEDEAYNLSHFFVVDSFNIHRLVIAGVTCASKFFSDVFYTNSRYAKVGGLPLIELNHLEIQFLLLNDFRLSIPAEELEAYGTMLVEFYAREVMSQRPARPREGAASAASVFQNPTPP